MIDRPSPGPAGLPGLTDTRTLAVGARTTVLAARDATSGQRVAVKLSHDAQGAARLAAEARALGAIGPHPNVVTLHRTDRTDDDRSILVLELCEGSLADRVDEHGPLPVRTAIAVAVRIAGALETASRAGVVHGALAPHDLLVTRYDEVVVGGFGSASPDPTPAPGAPRRRVPTAADDVRGLAEVLGAIAPPVGDPSTAEARALDELLTRCLVAPSTGPGTPLEFAQRLRAIEHDAGWDPTPCRIGGVDATIGTGVGPDPEVVRRGRAAATTGLPPLRLDAFAAPTQRGGPQLRPRSEARIHLPPSGRFTRLTAGWDAPDGADGGEGRAGGATGRPSGAGEGGVRRGRARGPRGWIRGRRRRGRSGGGDARS